MTSPDKIQFRSRLAWPALAMAALLAVLARRWAPDGLERGALLQFVGRFHPLLIHIPIALLALVPILELAGSLGRRVHLRSSAGFVLWLAAYGCVLAALDGWLLARGGGFGGAMVGRHMWAGVGLALVAIAAAAGRSGRQGGAGPGAPAHPLAYWPLLAGAVALMVWTAHLGGDITHGEGYLTEFMPARLRAAFGVPAPAPKATPAAAKKGPATVYTSRVEPLLERSCVSCHNQRRFKGGLRLDTYALLMKGGEDGPVIVPWDPAHSDFIRRVTLPPSDDEAMPSNGRRRLTPDEVKLVESWIAAGASPAQPLVTLK